MPKSTKHQRNVAKAYASGIMLDHYYWAVDPTPGEVKKERFCVVCKEVLTIGYDPTEMDIFGHQYDKLLEAGMGWLLSPTDVEKTAELQTDGGHTHYTKEKND